MVQMYCWPFQRCRHLHLYLALFSCLVSTRWNKVSCSCCIIPIWLTTAARTGPIVSFSVGKPAYPVTTCLSLFKYHQTNSPVHDSITYGFSTKGVCFCDKMVGLSGHVSLGSRIAETRRENERLGVSSFHQSAVILLGLAQSDQAFG